jgi:hypothetical protein
MTAAVPSVIIDLGILFAFFGTLVATAKLPPVRWLWHRLVVDPVGEFLDARNEAALRPAMERLREIEHLARHHLGPNGGSRAIHERMRAIEAAHGIEVEAER